jgi:heme exporter protein B
MLVTAPFGAVGLLLVPLAVGTDTPLLRQVGPGLYWVVVLLFGVLVTLRAGMLDTGGQRDLLRLWGVTARIRLAGRTLANMVLLLVFQAALAPVAIALYDPDLTGWPWLLPALVLVAFGLGGLGALADELVRDLRGRTTLGPLLIAPVAVPLLLGATQILAAARYGRGPWPWLLLMAALDIAVLLSAALTVPRLEETG